MSPDKHPHEDAPSVARLTKLIEATHPTLAPVYLGLHDLVTQTIPGIAVSVDLTDAGIGYGAHQFGYDGWGMAAVVPHSSWVSLVLFRGTTLSDPESLLEGTGASVRHVKIRTELELEDKRRGITALLHSAVNG